MRRPVISRLECAVLVGLVAYLYPVTSRAGIIIATRDTHDDREAVRRIADNPRVVAFHSEVDAFRSRLLRWKERDFVALFGPAVDADKGDEALMVCEARTLLLSGLHSENPEDDHTRTAAYRVAGAGRFVVYFGNDGRSPVHVLFYLNTDNEFIKLDRVENLDRRLAWERPRFTGLVTEVNRRWRQVVVWEIDTAKEKAQSQGVESADFPVKLRALVLQGKERGYALSHEPPRGNVPVSWRWYHGEVLIAEACHNNRGLKANEATPCDFAFYRSDGTLLRDDTGWPALEMIRWYRPDGETLARVETGAIHEGAWRPTEWCWYDRLGRIVRNEHDSNGDGIPDVYDPTDLAGQEPQIPLSVERSWAVNPGLIPIDLSNPGQPERRLPLSRIPE